MSDGPLKKAASDIAYRVYTEWEWDQLATRDVTDAIATAVVEAVEPLIRNEALAIARHESWGVLAGQRADERDNPEWARDRLELAHLRAERDNLRKNVEHMRRVRQREIDVASKQPGSFVMVDIGRREALDDVLDLMNRDSK